MITQSEKIRLFAAESHDHEPLAILPLRVEARKSSLAPRVLSSIGNYYTSYYAPLMARECKDDPQSAVRALMEQIQAQSTEWDILRLEPLPQDAAEFSEMAKAFTETGIPVQEYFCFGNWYLPTGGRSYREYFKSLPSITQNTVQRKTKKFEKSGRGEIQIVTGGPELEKAIAAYQAVYLASWKVPEPYPEFVPGLIRLCAREGWLRLGVVYVDGQPAASQLWVVTHGKAAIYKLAYDERYSELSVGSILTAKLMEYVLDNDRVAEIDYLTGDDPYKRQWMSHRRERWGIVAFNPGTIQGFAAAARHIGGRRLKRTMSRLRTRWQSRSKIAE